MISGRAQSITQFDSTGSYEFGTHNHYILQPLKEMIVTLYNTDFCGNAP